ncbi:hypothetical protein Hanom_Chr06g00519731 [Helianthus anomalus]
MSLKKRLHSLPVICYAFHRSHQLHPISQLTLVMFLTRVLKTYPTRLVLSLSSIRNHLLPSNFHH